MGRGRILNNYFHKLEPYEDLEEKSPYIQRMYRTHNIAYPDILYEKMQKQWPPNNVFVSQPMPPSDDTLLTYAEPSNIVTDAILYEQGTPDLPEDFRITGVIPSRFVSRVPGAIDAGGKNTVVTTEYNTGLNEKVRRDNPVVVIDQTGPAGEPVKKIARLKPSEIESRKLRRFNKDYDERGKPLQPENPVYETVDYLKDLRLTSEDFGYGENIGRISDESLSVFEDFVTKGRIREGYEIIASDDY